LVLVCYCSFVSVAGAAERTDAASARVGLDYVFPLLAPFEQEIWPQRFAEPKGRTGPAAKPVCGFVEQPLFFTDLTAPTPLLR
jgi:hypothetical protein